MVEEYVKYVGCVNNMRNIYTGVLSYSGDRNGNLPFYIRPSSGDGTLTVIASLWALPTMYYLVELPGDNPNTGNPWSMPGDRNNFTSYLRQHYPKCWDLLFCQAGDNSYYSRAYEGSRRYVSNYVGVFGPINHCKAAASKRDYQDNNPLQFNRPIRMGHDPDSTWLLYDIHWSGGWTAHSNDSKNLLFLDGSVMLTPREFWGNSYVYIDRYPE
jgi:prepilin-type processing-associated H-X9-DG protein